MSVLFPGGGTDSEKSDVGKRVKDQVFATIALKKAGSKNEVSTVTHIPYTIVCQGLLYYDPIDKNLFLTSLGQLFRKFFSFFFFRVCHAKWCILQFFFQF